MSESLFAQPDPADLAHPPLRVPADESRPVRQLPPPPRAAQQPAVPPRIVAGRDSAAGWHRWWAYVGCRLSKSFLISFVFHLLLLCALALVTGVLPLPSTFPGLIATIDRPLPLADLQTHHLEILPAPPDRIVGTPADTQSDYLLPQPIPRPTAAIGSGPAERESLGTLRVDPTERLLKRDPGVEGALDGRGREARTALALGDGGTPESETAVERGLRWLMAHQRRDGSWNFNHHLSPCGGQCRYPGSEPSTTAAVAIVLLPFLGAGYTHTEGPYQHVVQRGLYYLLRRTLVTPHGNDLQEGTMYAQGLAAIALCEAYAMTGDVALKDYAQGAIDFICYAQDPKGGGWRYTPGVPGDTTVTGWQLMGLKCGQMARLSVPRPTLYLAGRFLDGVQSYAGAQYSYLDPRPRRTTTAIGLLGRMYTGWGRDHAGLQRGVRFLDEWGPSDDNMYYNYYATLVMHHWQGPEWERWNAKIRDHLIATQADRGHENGSWHFSGGRGDIGGRLYNTAMAVMTLEVYYRYLPLYRNAAE